MNKIALSQYFFISFFLIIGLAGLAIFTSHQGFANRLLNISILPLIGGGITYLKEVNDK